MLSDVYQITLLSPEEEEVIKQIIRNNENTLTLGILQIQPCFYPGMTAAVRAYPTALY